MGTSSARTARTGGTPATATLDRLGIEHTLHPYEHDPSAASYGLEAAERLGVDPARVFKTLVLDTARPGAAALAVAVVPVSAHLDLRAAAGVLGLKKVTLADPADAERSSGYVVGGISPVGQRRRLQTVLDAGALDHSTILVSAGRRGLDVELAPGDLVRACEATVAPIAAH